MTPNDIGSISIYDDKIKIITTYIQKSDTIIVVKKYYAKSNKCYHTYELDTLGRMNGYNTYLDSLNHTTNFSYLIKDQLQFMYKINEKGDTTYSQIKLTDSTYIFKQINFSKNFREEWFADENGLKNGFYYRFDLATNHLQEKSNFIRINSNQISDKVLFLEQKIKYKMGSIILERESLPISTIIYNEKGRIESKKLFKWSGVNFGN